MVILTQRRDVKSRQSEVGFTHRQNPRDLRNRASVSRLPDTRSSNPRSRCGPITPTSSKVAQEGTLAEIDLFELRKALDLSQTDVAEELGISQSAVSQLERAGDLKLSTLRRYLARLGAQLHLVAVFDEDGGERRIEFRVGDG
jgi:DNA-binding XRE family transcriptional regulator